MLRDMKPEFSEVLMPANKLHTSTSTDSSIRLIGREKRSSNMDKCFISAAIIFAFVVAIVTTAFIVRYEDKMTSYETRMTLLEKELSGIYERFEDEFGPFVVNEKDFEYDIPNHPTLFGSDESAYDYTSKEDDKKEASHEEKPEEENGEHVVTMDMTRTRRKRQIPFQDLPTYGPEVERTADGVPILDRSYTSRDKTEPVRSPPSFLSSFSRYEPPTTTDSEGLRLYEGLQATGGRNEPRSLDHWGDNSGQNGILPHHRASASWSERGSRTSTRRRSSNIQLKSGDSQTSASNLPSGFGESTGPNFSEEVTYRRNSAGRGGGNRRRVARKCTSTITHSDGTTTTTTSSRNCANSNSGVGTRNLAGNSATQTRNQQSSTYSSTSHQRSSSSSDSPVSTVTYHRRSRVPDSDFLIPQQTNVRSLSYPPLQRFGRGDGEVIARVLQSDTDNEESLLQPQSQSSQSQSTTGQHSESSSSRQQGSRRVNPSRQAGQSAYKSERKVNRKTFRRTLVKNTTTQAFPTEESFILVTDS